MLAGCLVLLLAVLYVPAFQGANAGILLGALMFACCVLPMVFMVRAQGGGGCCGGHKKDADTNPADGTSKPSCH